MRKIAIFTSGNAPAAIRLASLFNEGNRIRVEAVVTDSREVLDAIREIDPTVILVDTSSLEMTPENLLQTLRDAGVEKVATENADTILPVFAETVIPFPVFPLSSEEHAPREVVAQFSEQAPAIPAGKPDVPPTPDEEWAAKLKMNFDPEVAREVPPPLPGQPQPRPQQGYPAQPAPLQGNAAGRPQQQEPMPDTYLVWSVLATVFCCLVPGIVAIVYASQVSSKYYAGDIEGARKSSRNAQIWIIVSFVLGVLSATLYLPIALIN